MNQRAAALLFVVLVVVFFAWEKTKLQQQVSENLRARNSHAAVGRRPAGFQFEKALGDQRRSPSPSPVVHAPPSTTRPTPRVTHRQEALKTDALPPLRYEIVANASGSCPLPVLHPAKFQAKMGWGIRKQFPPCVPGGRQLFASAAVVADGSVVVTVNSSCHATPKVWAFGELADNDFQRLGSTVDAEVRQNQLKERFARVEDFAAAVQPTGSKGARVFQLPAGKPYAVVECDGVKQLLITAPTIVKAAAPAAPPAGAIKNFLHVMIDSTSIYALRRSAKRIVKWLERVDAGEQARVHAMKHYHAVSCCSPGNQIPVYSGNMNGEGDFFVNSEPMQNSRDWLWNIARDKLGFRTFWSLDNCPDKSARDYHAYPSVDSRVVAPICLAGVLLSHKEATCLGGKFIDEQVIDGLESFWQQHSSARKFAAVQFITPHEESEKLLMELDEALTNFFERFERSGALNDTAVVFWSDHGINFGKYASTHDGEIEKMFPFANVIVPRWVSADVHRHLHVASDRLTTPYDLYEVGRRLLYYPAKAPKFSHDPRNPPLPRPEDSHIMASFQKDVDPVALTDRDLPAARSCWEANIPMEFCTCIPWRPTVEARYAKYYGEAVKAHQQLLRDFTGAGGPCLPVEGGKLLSTQVQVWPEEYKPKGKSTAKKIWMHPNRDMVKVHYETAPGSGHGIFAAVFSVDKSTGAFDLAQIDRLDAMQKKCGLVDKVREQLCICR
jgi:hypothetical protein